MERLTVVMFVLVKIALIHDGRDEQIQFIVKHSVANNEQARNEYTEKDSFA